MSYKVKPVLRVEIPPCEKFLNRVLKQETMASRRSQSSRPFQDKYSHLIKQPTSTQPQRPRQKSTVRQQSPVRKVNTPMIGAQKEQMETVFVTSTVREGSKSPKHKSPTPRSRSLHGSVKEAWGQILKSNKSRDKISSFSNFDPLRTLHFLSKELFAKLKNVIPEEGDVLQMVSDIQQALKRIPPEVSTFLHNPQIEYPQLDTSGHVVKTSTKHCQTPPTLYQEDREMFQKIMEENTFRLEESCKQLEMVCANLQSEKEMTEKELDQARENIELLCKRIKELETETEAVSNSKIKELEDEKQHLREQLERALKELDNNPSVAHLKKLVEELKKQKLNADEACARLEYDMTILSMEKEKLATMLAVRDKEINDIQGEMSKIQEQVNKQLKKLNTEVIQRSNSMKSIGDPLVGMPDNLFLEIGDTTISSITTNESDREPINIIKESPCGDAELSGLTKESQEEFFQKLKADNIEIDFQSTKNDPNMIFQNLINGLTPSVQAFLTSHDV